MYFLILFFLRSRSCSGNVKSSTRNPSAFGSKLPVDGDVDADGEDYHSTYAVAI